MSFIPLVVQSVLDEFNQPPRYLKDQNFGLGILNDDLVLNAPSYVSPLSCLRLYGPQSRQNETRVSTLKNDQDQFKVNLDVQQFKPEEVSVKVVGDYVVVEGKHEERKDQHGLISRQFVRKYKLPENVAVDAISSSISSDGVLSVVAPKITASSEKEKVIPVIRTNQPAIKKQETSAKSESKGEKMES